MGKDVTLEEGKQIKKFADVLGLNDLKPTPQVHEDKLWQVMTQEIAADSAVQAIESRGFCLESCIVILCSCGHIMLLWVYFCEFTTHY